MPDNMQISFQNKISTQYFQLALVSLKENISITLHMILSKTLQNRRESNAEYTIGWQNFPISRINVLPCARTPRATYLVRATPKIQLLLIKFPNSSFFFGVTKHLFTTRYSYYEWRSSKRYKISMLFWARLLRREDGGRLDQNIGLQTRINTTWTLIDGRS
jgi:hypothetical protein